MRRTPPVLLQLQPEPAAQAAVAVIAALTSAGLAAWALSHHAAAWPALLLVPLAALWAWRSAAARPRRLRWDGQAWWLAAGAADEETAVQLAVVMDLDAWLLLQARPGPCWLALSRRRHAAQWTALRATLFAAPGGAQAR